MTKANKNIEMKQKTYTLRILPIILSLYGLLCLNTVFAQTDSVYPIKSVSRQNFMNKNVMDQAKKVSKSLENKVDTKELAKDYILLAKEYIISNDLNRAEENFKKAEEIYRNEKDTKNLNLVYRELAKVQERIGKIKEAISNYEAAATTSRDKGQKKLNLNDAQRLRNYNNPKEQTKYIEENLEISKVNNSPYEITNAYRNLAKTNVQLEQKDKAIVNLEKAIESNKNVGNKVEAIDLKNELAQIYTDGKQFDEAILLKKNIVEEAKKEKDIPTQISQLQEISKVYGTINQDKKEETTLLEAYRISWEQRNTIGIKNSVELLGNFYEKKGNLKKSIHFYRNFLDSLENLLYSDSTLVDIHLLESTEEKIVQLEKERALLEKEKALKDELIIRKNTLNYVLILSIIAVGILLIFSIKAFFSIKKRNKKIALQSLRREMNPHFIFNSLNSINHFIAQNNELEANKYLTSYSNLMRNVMENSNQDFLRMDKELEQISKYLELEKMRFPEKFEYSIETDKNIDIEAIYLPNMLIQPNIENAIWHGLRYKEKKGILKVTFSQLKDSIQICINDDGIGLENSNKMKTKHQKTHSSRGLTNIMERINLLNNLYNTNISFLIKNNTDQESGVLVVINCPILFKNPDLC